MIALRAKNVNFETTYINLREKPDWFLEISAHGKVPVLKVDDRPLFESNAITEYLDEVVDPRLHPADPIERAFNRAWIEFVPSFSDGIGSVTYAKGPKALEEGVKKAANVLDRMEEALSKRGNDGPYFNGPNLSLVDAAFAPFLKRFAVAEHHLKTGLLKSYPLVQAWSDALLSNEVVTGSVPDNWDEEFAKLAKRREAMIAPMLGDAQGTA